MGANLAVLAQMMGSMPQIRPWDEAERSMNEAQTGLLRLQEMKRQQASAAEAREFYRQHPELLLGQGGGSVLGSLAQAPGGPRVAPGAGSGAMPGGPMTQQTMVPGQPPGAPQVVPGGQDLSRYAQVPPASGGPIPPGTMGQVMPTVTPPPQGMPTLATLGPQGQDPRLLDLIRRNPDAGLLVQQQMQQSQDLALKRDEQRLTMGTRIAEYIGRVAQGVTSQETLEQARQEMAHVAPQAAAQLPQTYSKEAMRPFLEKALSVKDSAAVRLETWKNQIEEQKVGVQLAQAGLQGLTPSVVQDMRSRGINPLGAPPKEIETSIANVQKRELAKEGEAQRLKFEQEKDLQSTLPLQDARKEDAGLFVYKGTGQGVPGTIPYGQVKTLQDEQDPNKGVVKLANLDEKKQLTTLKQLEPVLQQYADLVQYAYGPNGPLENYTRSPGPVLSAAAGQAVQNDPVFAAKRRALQGQLQSVVRGLGARGDLNEQELAAAKEMIANMDASMGLGISPMIGTGGLGIGFKPSFSLPDTPETGINLANELIGTVNRRIGSILQHEGYSKTPFITLRTNQQGQPQPGVMPQARPGSQAPPVSSTVPPRTWGEAQPATPGQPQAPVPGQGTAPTLPPAPPTPQAGPLGAPPQTRYVPPTPTATPVTPAAPVPPTATSTPAQDEAYRRSLQPQAPAQAPAPGRRSQAQTGRRGVELARASGMKVMDMADVREASEQTGRSPQEVIAAARQKGYRIYGGGTAMA